MTSVPPSTTRSPSFFGKYKSNIVTAITMGGICAALIHRGRTLYDYEYYHVRSAISGGMFGVGALVVMGATATLAAGTLLWIPFSRRRFAMRTELKQCISDAAAADAAFETACLTEYDLLMMTSETAASTRPLAYLNPLTVDTPRGKLVITYVPSKTAFGYYSDRKDSLAYTHLETAARMFLVKNERPDLAALAYADRRVTTSDAATPEQTAPVPVPESSSGVFAMFRKYNRKPAAPAASSSTADCGVVDTHFIYLGTMHDYEEVCAPKSPSGEYTNIDYAEFKKKTKNE